MERLEDRRVGADKSARPDASQHRTNKARRSARRLPHGLPGGGGLGGLEHASPLTVPRRAELAPPTSEPRPGRREQRGTGRGGWGSLAGDHWPLSPTCPLACRTRGR